jgi:hypothetical protein
MKTLIQLTFELTLHSIATVPDTTALFAGAVITAS